MKQFRIDADDDAGVPSRVLDLLGAADCFPIRMFLERDPGAGTLGLEIEIPAGATNFATRIGQIPGVRAVTPLTRILP